MNNTKAIMLILNSCQVPKYLKGNWDYRPKNSEKEIMTYMHKKTNRDTKTGIEKFQFRNVNLDRVTYHIFYLIKQL